ncbi:MAG TPA: sigma factor [Syntrophales bacterium]|nr:sigma factor [Syntrophales bacterium]
MNVARWEELYTISGADKVLSDIYNYSRRAGFPRQDAEDAYQYALEASFQNLEKLQDEPDKFRAWLFGTARNYLRKQYAKKTHCLGFWVVGKQVFRMKADADRAAFRLGTKAVWHTISEEIEELCFTDAGLNGEEQGVAEESVDLKSVFELENAVSPEVHPRRHSFRIKLRPNISEPTSKRGRIMFDLLKKFERPVRTNILRPIVRSLFKRDGLSSQFKWSEFVGVIEEV